MTKDEALKLALEALELTARDYREQRHAIAAIREALAQPEQNEFNPDWDAMAVMVEEQQRMAKRIAELEAQRKPLTDEEIENLWQNTSPYYDYQDFARAIEAAHGIKE